MTSQQVRDLKLKALDEAVNDARAKVIESAMNVMTAVAATEGEWRGLEQVRETIISDANAEASRLLQEAHEREQKLARILVWLNRISQGSPPTFLAAGELLERPVGERPKVFEWSRTLLDPEAPEAS